MQRPEEERLVDAVRRGDRDAASELVRAHQRSLYAYIFRMCNRPHLAEDVVQEAFVRAITNIHRFDPKYRFSTWLFVIAKRVYLNGAQRKRPAYDSDVIATIGERDGTVTASASGRVEATDERAAQAGALNRALGQLTEDQREVLILFHQHDWPISLIASHLGMPEGTVKSHLHRGRRRLREVVLESESDSAMLGLSPGPAGSAPVHVRPTGVSGGHAPAASLGQKRTFP